MRNWFIVALCCLVFLPAAVWAAPACVLGQNPQTLLAQLKQSAQPLKVLSNQSSSSVDCTVFGVIAMPLSQLRSEVSKPQSWCSAMVLHYNIKAATYQEQGAQTLITLYGGQKYYQLPNKENALYGVFSVDDERAGHFKAVLLAAKGPFGSSNHRIEVEAVEISPSRCLVGLRYSYAYNQLARRGLEAYLRVQSADKVGLTVIGTDQCGRAQYVKGIRGAAERNGLRYYLALEAYLLNRDTPGDCPVARRLNCWYDLNEAYPRQLHEFSRAAYLDMKLREYRNQVGLQQKLNPSA